MGKQRQGVRHAIKVSVRPEMGTLRSGFLESEDTNPHFYAKKPVWMIRADCMILIPLDHIFAPCLMSLDMFQHLLVYSLREL